MRAQFVYQSLNEKFTQNSDPIKDLQIGLYYVVIWIASMNHKDISSSQILELIKKNNVNYKIIRSHHTGQQGEISYYSLFVKFIGTKKDLLNLCDDFYKIGYISTYWYHNWTNIKFFKNVNEKFTEDSDPIKDMGIGIEVKLQELLKKYPYLKWESAKAKDYARIKMLIDKSKGNLEKELMYAKNMAKAITDEEKAYRRYQATKYYQRTIPKEDTWEVPIIFLIRTLELFNII